MDLTERRQHRRLNIRLPLECRTMGEEPQVVYRTVTLNVSTGGLYFELDTERIREGMLLELSLTVPPGDGHFPYHGSVHCVGEVVRVQKVSRTEGSTESARDRFGIAAKFREGLTLSF